MTLEQEIAFLHHKLRILGEFAEMVAGIKPLIDGMGLGKGMAVPGVGELVIILVGLPYSKVEVLNEFDNMLTLTKQIQESNFDYSDIEGTMKTMQSFIESMIKISKILES